MNNIKKANNARKQAEENAIKERTNAKREKIRLQAIASEALGFTKGATQEAVVALNELKLEHAQQIAEAEQLVRDTIDDERKTQVIAENLLRDENNQLKRIVTGKNNKK